MKTNTTKNAIVKAEQNLEKDTYDVFLVEENDYAGSLDDNGETPSQKHNRLARKMAEAEQHAVATVNTVQDGSYLIKITGLIDNSYDEDASGITRQLIVELALIEGIDKNTKQPIVAAHINKVFKYKTVPIPGSDSSQSYFLTYEGKPNRTIQKAARERMKELKMPVDNEFLPTPRTALHLMKEHGIYGNYEAVTEDGYTNVIRWFLPDNSPISQPNTKAIELQKAYNAL